MREKPSRQYIKKAMAEKYDYTNEANIKKTLGQMVKFGKLIQEGQNNTMPPRSLKSPRFH